MGALLVILSVICWVLGKVIDFNHIPSLLPWAIAAKNTRGVLAGTAMGLSLSLSVALLFMEFTSVPDIGSYYQLNIAMIATFITLNALLVFVSINYPLLELFGTEFERLAIVACCLTDCLFVLAIFVLVFTINDKGFEFGDTPCFDNRLGTSALSNPLFYSVTFFIPAVMARILLLATILLKRIVSGTFLSQRVLPYISPSSGRKLRECTASLEKKLSIMAFSPHPHRSLYRFPVHVLAIFRSSIHASTAGRDEENRRNCMAGGPNGVWASSGSIALDACRCGVHLFIG
jgi:hypothetical protein